LERREIRLVRFADPQLAASDIPIVVDRPSRIGAARHHLVVEALAQRIAKSACEDVAVLCPARTSPLPRNPSDESGSDSAADTAERAPEGIARRGTHSGADRTRHHGLPVPVAMQRLV